MSDLEEIGQEALEIAKSKGYFDEGQDHAAIKLMKVVDEVSELHTVHARGHDDEPSDKIPAFTRAEEECADVVISILAWAAHKGMRITAAVRAKNRFNRTRPLMHGGKKW